MYSFAALAVLTASLIGRSLAIPIQVSPGSDSDVTVHKNNTLNGTLAGGATGTTAAPTDVASVGGNPKLGLVFQNNFASGPINVYIQGLDPKGQICFVLPDGSFYYPPATTSSTPVKIAQNLAIPLGAKGSSKSLKMPNYLSSGRVYAAAGTLSFYLVSGGLVQPSVTNPKDPNIDVNYGFAEFSNNAQGIYADVSFVDFLGIPLGLSLQSTGGTQTVKGVGTTAVSDVCSALKAQAASDGAPWDELCVTDAKGNLVRVIAPTDYISATNTGFNNYWSSYIDQVWTKYTTSTLTIDTQVAAGKVACKVTSGTLTCAGDNRGYAKPSAADIFGCDSGPFKILKTDNSVHAAIVPRLCAAFDRSTLLLTGGDVQPSLPSSSYYTVSPTNHFSRIVHKYELGGLGYAFAYDDVASNGAPSAAGLVSDANPQVLTMTIGGPSS